MDKIKEMIKALRPEFDFDESENFIEDGLLDSFDIVALISNLEEEFGITVDGLEIVPENFISFEAIEELVKKSEGTV